LKGEKVEGGADDQLMGEAAKVSADEYSKYKV